MKKLLFCMLASFSLSSFAVQKNSCVVINSSVEIALRQVLVDDVGLDPDELDLKQSRLELIDNVLITDKLAKQYAREDIVETKNIDYMDIYNIYKSNNARNLIVKYTYFNKQGKKNVYIGSALVDALECSLGFKGYLTVSREF
ncbi:hypothetical protein ABU178_03635 [Pantoea osteomyelitidis]|uniref:Shiga toxin A subunit n=1 Tax=Pantoea osteomyelitidis TaxID=3230026 RepID=A0ABW7PU05_9GAMM